MAGSIATTCAPSARCADDHKFVSLAIQNGDLATLGGDIEALCSGVVGQHVGAIADRVGAADPSGGDVHNEQGGVAVARHKRNYSGWVESQAADAVVAA